ncbi:hypothetical protein CAEBREN_05185 [Caenorhabditis brenneri]|uniref:G-protein coupled receptors family 1 profile domain-containing protein n=1 Tax=Caenorhabditis brenneri TaxID=135651 RepID=G0M961_CAEBE|nr:hypothetical protein CAEBREN_05185 [Caenorhabditis brenneri]
MIFLTIFILVESTKTTNRVEPEKSELKLFADNFRILSRVTDAIHLQSVFARKKFKIEDLLAELLEVKPDRFETLMHLPIDPAKAEVNRIHKAHENSTVTTKISREAIREYIHAIDVLSTLVNNEDRLNQSAELPADFIFKAAKNIQSYSMGQCETLDEKNLVDFQRLFPKDSDSFEFPNDTTIKKILKTFESKSKDLIDCLGSFETMNDTSHASDVQAANETYGLLRSSFKIVFDFAMRYQKIQNLSSFSKELKDEIKSNSIWQRNNKKLGEVMSRLNKTFDSYVTQKKHDEYYTRLKKNTAGFRDAESLPMVFNDLKHPWFVGVIAQNKSTEELQSALEPYRNLYSKISALGTTWKKTISREVDELIISNTKEAVEKIKNITLFSEDSSRYLEILKNSSDIVSCLTSKPIDLTKFGEFRRGHQPMEEILKKFLKLNHDLNIIKNHILYPAYGDHSRNFVYQNLINSTVLIIKNSGKEDVLMILNRIREEIDKQIGNIKSKVLDEKFDFLEGLERLSELVKGVKKLKKKAKKLIDSRVKIKDLLSKKITNVFEVVDCLKKKNFDADSLQFSLYVFDGLLTLPNNNTVGYINQFLDQLKKIQIDYANVKTVFLKDQPSYPTVSNHSKIFKSTESIGIYTQQLGENLKFIENLEETRLSAKLLPNITEFPEDIRKMIEDKKLEKWVAPFEPMKTLLDGIREVNEAAKNVNNSNFVSIEKVFEEAAKVHGIYGDRKELYRLYQDLQISHLRDKADALKYFKIIHKLDLQFSAHRSSLKNSRVGFEVLKHYFDNVFGNVPSQDVQYIKEVSWVAILGSCVGLVLLLLIGALLFYGMTENGRTKYADLWMYYFGSKEDFDKRWRYCRFLDYSNGRNHMLEAVREVNTTNLLKALKAGVYINAYNRHGNTALHVATKLGHPELVKILIKHGADRTLLNGQNRTPEQMIITKSSESLSDKPVEFQKIMKIYNKYRKKKFRLKVPPKFPESSFHIWIDEEVNVDLYNKFVGKFQSISSDEVSTATHCVVKTDENGVLHTDSLDLLSCIFHGIIIVRDTWLTDSLADESLIMEDSKYLVESVMYKGTKFDTVLKWSEAMAKGTMPYLYGVYVAAVMTEYDNLYTLTSIVESQGGMVMDQFPLKKYFNKNTHPYLHAHLGPIFLIHDGSINLKLYKNDPDKMYTLFTEQEFISFLLKREINRDTRENLILDYFKSDFVRNELYVDCYSEVVPYYVLMNEFFTANNNLVHMLVSYTDAILSKFIPCILFPVSTYILIREIQKADIRRQKIMSTSATKTSENTSKLVLYLTLTFFVAEFPLGIIMLFYPIIAPVDDYGPHAIFSAFEATLTFILYATTATHMIICVFMSSQYRETTLLVVRFGYPWKLIPCILFPVSTYFLMREIRKAEIRQKKMMSSSMQNNFGRTSKLVLYLTLTFFVAEFPLGIVFLLNPSVFGNKAFGPHSIVTAIEGILMLILSATTATHLIICVFMSSQYRETALLVIRFGYPWKDEKESNVLENASKV